MEAKPVGGATEGRLLVAVAAALVALVLAAWIATLVFLALRFL